MSRPKKNKGNAGVRLKVEGRAAEIAASRIEDISKIAEGRAAGINRWMQKCLICSHKDRRAMNEDILRGMLYREFAEKWGGDLANLNQYMAHRRRHLFDLVGGLVAVDQGARMLRLQRFPMDGSGYEQADFVVRQLGYYLDQKRFGSVVAKDGIDPHDSVRKDCLAILRAVVVRDRLRGERLVNPVGADGLNESDVEILSRAREYLTNVEREDGAGESGDDDAAGGNGEQPAAAAAPVGQGDGEPATDAQEAGPAAGSGERIIDDILGAEPGPTEGSRDPAERWDQGPERDGEQRGDL